MKSRITTIGIMAAMLGMAGCEAQAGTEPAMDPNAPPTIQTTRAHV